MTRYRLGTFSAPGGAPFAGLEVDGKVLSLGDAGASQGGASLRFEGGASLLGLLEHWTENVPVLEGLAAGMRERSDAAVTAVEQLRIHAPLVPRQIYCSGANYKKHVVQIIVAQSMHETAQMTPEERHAWGVRKMDERAATGTPYFFCKAPSAVTGPYDPVIVPKDVKQADWELELGVVIGRRARRVRREQALDYVAGYMVVNDVTSRERVNRAKTDVPEMGMNWVLSKSSPTFLPVGPYLVPAAFVGDPQQLQITLKLNGQTMQDESTADMIFGVARQIEELSSACELQPGDLICTGSPAGNGMHYKRFLQAGDVLEGTITHLGTQRNLCVAEAETGRCAGGRDHAPGDATQSLCRGDGLTGMRTIQGHGLPSGRLGKGRTYATELRNLTPANLRSPEGFNAVRKQGRSQ